MKRYVDFPNEIIQKCITEEDGLTYDALGFLFHLKLLFKNCKIDGTTCAEISRESKINIYTVKKYFPVLLKNNLVCTYRSSTIIYSDKYLKKTYGNVAIRNIIFLNGCETIKDFSARIKLSLVLRKINQIEYSVKEMIKNSPDFIYDNQYCLDTYLCIGSRKLAESIGCSNGDVNRLLRREQKNGNVDVKHVYFELDKIPDGASFSFVVCNIQGKKPIAHFGSLIKVNCVYNFCEIEEKVKTGTVLYIVSNDQYSILNDNKINKYGEYNRVS